MRMTKEEALERDVSYCQCDYSQCVSEIGFEEDRDRPKYCKPKWKKMKARIAFDIAFKHKKLSQREFLGITTLEEFQ